MFFSATNYRVARDIGIVTARNTTLAPKCEVVNRLVKRILAGGIKP